ncbi:hypothetical protein N7533_005496 [Penicillium manginii]|uniref:uncharacterized protein n=1 Tax=Penicillium manginii TaxID=203109 RepID=UPI002548AD03|nr:uncharacterized protein N7533_005496 [Penicillium manginii]KAJ5755953.1 hypothetical protein N7533_005496 [Penicillium manginii]
MPQEFIFDSDDTDYSETDVSITGRKGRTSVRRRSISRHRRPEVASAAFLQPTTHATRVYRSASTGGNRRRERDPGPSVTIVNELAQRSNNNAASKPKMKQSKVIDVDDFEEDVHRSRRRAASGISRDASPFQPQQRDLELLMEQRLLERNDNRQDLELFKQQQEIERLERQLEKHRERVEPPRDSRELRSHRAEEEWYEDEISERLRKLEKQERKSHNEEERRKADALWRLKKFEEESHLEEEQRKANAQWRLKKFEDETRLEEERRKADAQWRLKKFEEETHNAEERRKAEHEWRLKRFEEAEKEAADRKELKEKMEELKLKEMAREKEEREERERLKKEFMDEQARAAKAAQEKRDKEMLMKKAAVDEWKMEQEKAKQAAKEAQEKKDKEFRERLRHEYGYSEEEIEKMLNKEKHKKEEHKKHEEHKHEEHKTITEETKTTWIKVHRKHLLPETLLAYNLPWDWDERDSNYIIIKKWVTEDFQEELFAHSRRIREGKIIAQTSSSTTELKVNDRKKDKMYLVRKKSPGRRFMFV